MSDTAVVDGAWALALLVLVVIALVMVTIAWWAMWISIASGLVGYGISWWHALPYGALAAFIYSVLKSLVK